MENPYVGTVNGSLWSLPVEISMYLVVPIVITMLMRLKKKEKYLIGLGIVVSLICFYEIFQLLFFPEWHYLIYDMDVAQIFMIVPYYFIRNLLIWVFYSTNSDSGIGD